jgi:predicted RNA-binding Zn-ribbon protein involved in translation (DUF1610 family)
MTTDLHCPACGEAEDVHGSRRDGHIEITCGSCGHRWVRGERVCRSCGGAEHVTVPQVMKRTSRGNQLSVLGHRDVELCPVCDAEMIATCRTARQWVPEDYVPAFSRVRIERSATDPQLPTTQPTSSAPAPPRRSVPSQAPEPPQAPETAGPAPTVRQAVADYMDSDPGADPLAMLGLAGLLGSGTRVDALGADTGPALQQWFEHTWGHQDQSRQAAVAAAVRRAFAHWTERGWIADDPSAGLSSTGLTSAG